MMIKDVKKMIRRYNFSMMMNSKIALKKFLNLLQEKMNSQIRKKVVVVKIITILVKILIMLLTSTLTILKIP